MTKEEQWTTLLLPSVFLKGGLIFVRLSYDFAAPKQTTAVKMSASFV